MASERLLIDYLPPFLREFREMRFIMAAIQPEIDTLYEAMQNALDDQYIQYATESGIKRWEKMLKITPKDTETLEERRFRLLTIMGKETPYTLIKLHEMLTGICGEGNYSVEIKPSGYHIAALAFYGESQYLPDFQGIIDSLEFYFKYRLGEGNYSIEVLQDSEQLKIYMYVEASKYQLFLVGLEAQMKDMFGEGNFSIQDQKADYFHIMVLLSLANQNNYQQVVDMLSNTLPANLTQTVQIQYNHYGILKQFTHEELTAYTHNQLRNEVFLNG